MVLLPGDNLDTVFARWCEKNSAKLMSIAKKQCQSNDINSEDIWEDIRQDSIVALYKKLWDEDNPYKPDYPLLTYFRAIAKNMARNQARKDKRLTELNEDITTEDTDTTKNIGTVLTEVSEYKHPELYTYHRMLNEGLYQALQFLPEDKQDLLVKWASGYTIEELALELCLSESGVRKRVSRTSKTLKPRLTSLL